MATTTIFNATALANGTSALTQRSTALATSTDLVQAGAVFNDSTRLLDGGLWSTPNDNHNQPAYLGMYTSDLHAVLNDITAMLATPTAVTSGGAALTLTTAEQGILTTVEGQINSLIADAPQSVGTSATATAAQTAIHSLQTSIISEINGDTGLQTALAHTPYMTATGATNVGFQASVVGADTAADLTQAMTAGDTLAHIGSVFNAAANVAIGGLNTTNMTEFNADIQAVATGVQNILNSPSQLATIETGESASAASLTTIHLQTIENELQLQTNTVDGLYATNPNVAARETNDNLLDIIDIVQNDASLNKAAGGNGTPAAAGGFAEQPSYLTGTITHFQDNQAETNFWANFSTQANVLGSQTVNVATQIAAGTLSATSATATQLISEIQTYQHDAQAFDQQTGGIFGARFDNELLNGTLEADSAAAISAIQNGNVAQATAAAQGFIADEADVSGNNIPVGGGAFVSQVLTTGGVNAPNPNATVAAATTPNGVAVESSATATAIASAAADPATTAAATTATGAAATTTATATPATTAGATAATAPAATTTATAATTTSTSTSTTDTGHHDHGGHDFGQQFDFGQHFHHMWG